MIKYRGTWMHAAQRILLIVLTCLCSATLSAQTGVNIVISGVNAQMENNVRQFLSLEQQKDHALLSEGRIRHLHSKAPLEIARALQPYGYYRPVIKSTLTQPAAKQWLANYSIDPGTPIPVGEFSLTLSKDIAEDIEFQTLISGFSLQKGRIFSHIEYEDLKTSLANLAAERGYFDAHFIEHRVAIDLDAYEARIRLNYAGGRRYHFGTVSLQQEVLDAGLLRRYITFEEGAPYAYNALIDLQQALNDSDYFSSVEVSQEKPLPDSYAVPINVQLLPHKDHRFKFGLGYGSDTGARATLGWQMPRVNTHGHRLDTEANISEIGYALSASYRVPVLNPRTDQMVYSAGIVNEKTDSSESTIRTIGASLKRNHNDWRESISLNYQRESYIIADTPGESVLLIPGVNWSRIWGNNFIYTIDGLRFDIGLRGASTRLVSDTGFTQLQGGIKFVTSINPQNRFIANGRLGATWTETFEQLPSSVRFFAGGSQSVRGYAYQSLGPVDADGNVVGGQYLMIGSIEYEHSFSGKWGAALFYDGGNAIDSFADDLQRGAGFGLRWKSPVGMVRIDLASAITQQGQPWRLHINIGPDL